LGGDAKMIPPIVMSIIQTLIVISLGFYVLWIIWKQIPQEAKDFLSESFSWIVKKFKKKDNDEIEIIK